MKREQLLLLIKKAIHKEGITNGGDLTKIAKRVFGPRFIGIYEIKKQTDVPALNEGQVAILNTKTHWYGIYKKASKLYETDSYGQDRLGPNWIDKVPPKSFIQGKGGIDKGDCGQRCVVSLIMEAL